MYICVCMWHANGSQPFVFSLGWCAPGFWLQHGGALSIWGVQLLPILSGSHLNGYFHLKHHRPNLSEPGCFPIFHVGLSSSDVHIKLSHVVSHCPLYKDDHLSSHMLVGPRIGERENGQETPINVGAKTCKNQIHWLALTMKMVVSHR